MNKCSQKEIEKMIPLIKQGQVFIFPTETSYGLGGDARNQTAVNKIFQIKGRPDDKPLLIVVQNLEEAKKYLEWNETIDKIAQQFWNIVDGAGCHPESLVTCYFTTESCHPASQRDPFGACNAGSSKADSDKWIPHQVRDDKNEGIPPLTIVGKAVKDCGLASGVVAKDGTVAVRVTHHLWLKELLEKVKCPLVATSANLSGTPNLYQTEEVINVFNNKKISPDFFVDGGDLPLSPPSTLVRVIDDQVEILRQGLAHVSL